MTDGKSLLWHLFHQLQSIHILVVLPLLRYKLSESVYSGLSSAHLEGINVKKKKGTDFPLLSSLSDSPPASC